MRTNESKAKVGIGKDKHRTIENIGESIGASCHEIVPDSRPDLGAEHSGNPPIVGSLNLHHLIGRNRGAEASSIGTKKSLGPRAQFMNYYHLMNIFLSEHHQWCVRNVIKNSLFLPNFFLTLITYGLLSYSVCLHCANLHTPLPFLFYLYDFRNMKTRHPDLFCAILSKGNL